MKKIQLKIKEIFTWKCTNLTLILLLAMLASVINTFVTEFIAETILAILISIMLVYSIKGLKTDSKSKLDDINKNAMRLFKVSCTCVVIVAIVFNLTTNRELLNKYIEISINLDINELLDKLIRYADSCTKIISISILEILDSIKYIFTRDDEVKQLILSKYNGDFETNIIKLVLGCRKNIKVIKLAIQFNFITVVSLIISILGFHKNIKRK